MEGLYNYVVAYPYFFVFLALFIGYIDYVMITLLFTGRVVPIYKRPFPTDWQTLKESFYQDFTNLQIIVDDAFPFWRQTGLIVLRCILAILLILGLIFWFPMLAFIGLFLLFIIA